jgi:AcrR family transcriptional regulator
MVHHARAQIVAVGVGNLSVNEVLRLSGGSKATLVKYFGDKTGLIAAAIHAEARAAMASLPLDLGAGAAMPLERGLTILLEGVLRFYMQPAAIRLYRAVVSAATDDAGGAQAFYEHGHLAIVETIAEFLDARKGADVAPLLDSRDTADMLVHAIRAGIYERALLGLTDAGHGEAAIQARVRSTLALVLPAIRRAIAD